MLRHCLLLLIAFGCSSLLGASEEVTLRVGAAAGAQPLSYTWSLDSAPAGAGAVDFSAPVELDAEDQQQGISNKVLASIADPQPGLYVFTVTISDSQGRSVSSTVSMRAVLARQIHMQILAGGQWRIDPSGTESTQDQWQRFGALQSDQSHTLEWLPESVQ